MILYDQSREFFHPASMMEKNRVSIYFEFLTPCSTTGDLKTRNSCLAG
jgi:hypothetical protein